MEGDNNHKKLVNKKNVHSQAREIMYNIYEFLKREAEYRPILLKIIQDRVAQATGISRSSVQKILGKHKSNLEAGHTFSTQKNIPKE